MSGSQLGAHLSPADFLCITDVFSIPASLTDSKAVFLERIGFNHQCYVHRQAFDQMMVEAVRAREAFKSYLQHGSVHEQVFERATASIYQTASAVTRPIYGLMGGVEHNWVTRWLLWHAIEAAHECSQASPVSPESVNIKEDDTVVDSWAIRRYKKRTSAIDSASPGSPGQFWDPIRDG